MIGSHGYTNYVRHTDLITWVSKNAWERLLSEFLHAERITACTRTIIFNKYEQNNMRGDILNAGDNVDYQENDEFTESYFKIVPTIIDDYITQISDFTKSSLLYKESQTHEK